MSDRVREEFEARFPREEGVKLDDDGLYSGPWASFYNARWEAWQASRESLVIELPDNRSLNFDECAVRAKDQCAKAIEAAGVKVK